MQRPRTVQAGPAAQAGPGVLKLLGSRSMYIDPRRNIGRTRPHCKLSKWPSDITRVCPLIYDLCVPSAEDVKFPRVTLERQLLNIIPSFSPVSQSFLSVQLGDNILFTAIESLCSPCISRPRRSSDILHDTVEDRSL